MSGWCVGRMIELGWGAAAAAAEKGGQGQGDEARRDKRRKGERGGGGGGRGLGGRGGRGVTRGQGFVKVHERTSPHTRTAGNGFDHS